ncbi:hypothetical protein AGMMS50293_22960 [Spirochaetia bacterium]|nr:hypothetical protein AGMMS50293_22960 [Spirochaetia bacterium]
MKNRFIRAAILMAGIAALALTGCDTGSGGGGGQSSNADLASLSVSAGTLSPAFSAATTAYTVDVGSKVNFITVNAAVADTEAAYQILNATDTPIANPNSIGLIQGDNIIKVKVTAEDGTIKTYTITVNKAAPVVNNANLESLTVEGYTLVPAFSPVVDTYTVNVPNAVSSVLLTSATEETDATTYISGDPRNLSVVGSTGNEIIVEVTAIDGTTTKEYTITIIRAEPVANNANLANLTVDGVQVPGFSPTTYTGYSVNVSNSQTSVLIWADPQESAATKEITAGNPNALAVGANTITVTVTNGSGSQAYTITVNRAAVSNNANLSSLFTNYGLSPTFHANTTAYTLTVPNGVSTINVFAAAADTKAAITRPDNPNALSVGANTIPVTVTAEDGTTVKTYTITVTREAKSDNANLSTLALSAGTLSPTFAPGTTSYTATVPYSVSTVNVLAFTEDGNAWWDQTPDNYPVSLNVGSNPITVKVTAENGTAIKTYTINVTRTAASSNANLTSLSISPGTLNETFNADTTSYTATVPYSSITVNKTAVAGATAVIYSGTPNELADGENTIVVRVTAENGTATKDYTITVTKTVTSSPAVTVLITKADEKIDLTKNTANDLSRERGDMLSISVPAGYDYYIWYLDGQSPTTRTSNTPYSISASSINSNGTHSVLVEFYKTSDGIRYGSEVTFRVVR